MPELCPLCKNSTTSGVRLRPDRDETLYHCRGCQYAWTRPLPSLDYLKSCYSTGYTDGIAALLKNKRLAEDYWKKIRPYLPSKKFRMLEIGGAYGFFCDMLQKHTGADTTLLECGEEAARYAETELGLKVYRCFLEEFKSDETFDVIFSGHVVEHLCDVEGYLRLCFQRLNPGGLLITLTPNTGSWKFKLLGAYWCWASPEHLSFLGPASARKLHYSAGFDRVEIATCVPDACHYPGLLIGCVSRFKNLVKFRKKQTGVPENVEKRAEEEDLKRKKAVQTFYGLLHLFNRMEQTLWGYWEEKAGCADELLVVGRRRGGTESKAR